MSANQTICIVVMLAVVLLFDKCLGYPSIRQRQEAKPRCEGCGDFCDECKYGVVTSALCEISQCKKGPGERCGGYNEALGVCGEGMKCSCEECTGCSTDTYQCYDNRCLPHETLEPRILNIFARYPSAK